MHNSEVVRTGESISKKKETWTCIAWFVGSSTAGLEMVRLPRPSATGQDIMLAVERLARERSAERANIITSFAKRTGDYLQDEGCSKEYGHGTEVGVQRSTFSI